jgi:cysteine-rich repeat protein
MLDRFSLILLVAFPLTACPIVQSSGASEVDAGPSAAICGNRIVEEGEECDDGNPRRGVCDENCQLIDQPVCGDGEKEGDEECDDGNLENGDGCSSRCVDELNESCGNREMDRGEQCDDGNRENGDGCDDRCQAEGEACGNDFLALDEGCDDGNTEAEDGCSATCTCEELIDDHGGEADDSASEIALNLEPTAAILACGDVDTFVFVAPEAGLYGFETHGDIDPICAAFDAEVELSANDDGGEGYNCFIGIELAADQTVFYKVRHYNAEKGTGQVSVTVSQIVDDHGSTWQEASPLAEEGDTAGAIDIAGDLDFFAVEVAAGDHAFGTVTEEGSRVDTLCALFGDAGQELVAASETNDDRVPNEDVNCRIEYTFDAPTTAYLRVGHWERDLDNPVNRGAYGVYVDRP